MNYKSLAADQYYTLGQIPKLLRISKKTFYKIKQWPNFPKVEELSATFKVVARIDMDNFAIWYQQQKEKEKQHWIIEQMNAHKVSPG